MSDDDKTPIERQDTLGLILESCNRTEAQARETRLYAERSHDISMQMFQEHKALKAQVDTMQRQAWLPAALAILAAIISIACATVAAAGH